MTTRVLTLSAETNYVMTTSVTTMHFFIEIMSTLKAINCPFERSYDKQNITLVVVISYEIIKLAEGSFDKFHMGKDLIKGTLWQ